MTAQLERPDQASAVALEEFDRRRAVLVAEVERSRAERSRILGQLSDLEVASLTDGRSRVRDAEKLRRRLAEIDATLPAKEAALAATLGARRDVARPVAEAEFVRIAGERDVAAAEHAELLAEQDRILERAVAINRRLSDLELDDQRARRAQDRAIDNGDLPFQPTRAIADGVVSGLLEASLAQVRHARTYNAAPQ